MEINGGGLEIVSGNLIGVAPGASITLPLANSTFTPLPNTGNAVDIHNNSTNDVVGANPATIGTNPSAAPTALDANANIIYYGAGANGVDVADGGPVQILSNSIFGTGAGLGILLGNTANVLPAATQINPPTIDAAPVYLGATTDESLILGRLNEPLAGNYTVQVFYNDANAPNGKYLIATRTVAVATANTDTTFCVDVTVPDGDALTNPTYVTSTATYQPTTGVGSTSEFSKAVQNFNALVVTTNLDPTATYNPQTSPNTPVTLREALYYVDLRTRTSRRRTPSRSRCLDRTMRSTSFKTPRWMCSRRLSLTAPMAAIA